VKLKIRNHEDYEGIHIHERGTIFLSEEKWDITNSGFMIHIYPKIEVKPNSKRDKTTNKTLKQFRDATFYFETKKSRREAYEILARRNLNFAYGDDLSLVNVDNPDYMLGLLAHEGFDTSKVLVKRNR